MGVDARGFPGRVWTTGKGFAKKKKKVHILHIATMLLAQTILMLHSLSVSQIKT